MASPEQPTTASPRPTRAHAPILLIDDQRFVGLALARLLEGEPGFELHCCERGAEAGAAADRIRPALILQDLVMPDADGLTLVQAFRQRASTAHTPVIVLSGNDDASTRERALAAGAADYLVKLPAKDMLLACLDRHLSAPAGTPAKVTPAAATASDDALDSEFLADYRDAGADDPDETLRALLDVFQRDAAALLDDVRAAAAAGDGDAVRRLAHALKGCALAAGARALAAVSGELETGTLAPGPGVTRLEAELARARESARRYARPAGGHLAW